MSDHTGETVSDLGMASDFERPAHDAAGPAVGLRAFL